jgi:hypothetical protein
MSNVIPLGITHDPGCRCPRCLNEAYASAKVQVTECSRRYGDIRVKPVNPAEISRARQQWTESRQVLIMTEHDLRAAEDEARIELRKNQRVDALRWNPGEVR